MPIADKRKQSGPLQRLLRRLTFVQRSQAVHPAGPQFEAPGDGQLSVLPDVRVSAHADGLVLFHIPSGRVFLCNRTGARVWQGLSKGLNLEAITEQISREYGVARDLVEQHTAAFLTDLEQHGFVTRPGEC